MNSKKVSEDGITKDVLVWIIITIIGVIGTLAAFYLNEKVKNIVENTFIETDKVTPELRKALATIITEEMKSGTLSEATIIQGKIENIHKIAESLVTEKKIFERATSLVPIGAIVPYAGPFDTSNGFIRKGKILSKTDPETKSEWLACNGADANATDYYELSKVIKNIYGGKDDPATGKLSVFYLPDYRGMFIRGFDDGRDIDKDRILGKEQKDNVGKHEHKYNRMESHAKSGTEIEKFESGGTDTLYQSLTDEITTTSDTEGETRPKNISVNFLIRAK